MLNVLPTTQTCLQSRNPKVCKNHVRVVALGFPREIRHMSLPWTLGFVAFEVAALDLDTTCTPLLVGLEIHSGVLHFFIRWVATIWLGTFQKYFGDLFLDRAVHFLILILLPGSSGFWCLGFLFLTFHGWSLLACLFRFWLGLCFWLAFPFGLWLCFWLGSCSLSGWCLCFGFCCRCNALVVNLHFICFRNIFWSCWLIQFRCNCRAGRARCCRGLFSGRLGLWNICIILHVFVTLGCRELQQASHLAAFGRGWGCHIMGWNLFPTLLLPILCLFSCLPSPSRFGWGLLKVLCSFLFCLFFLLFLLLYLLLFFPSPHVTLHSELLPPCDDIMVGDVVGLLVSGSHLWKRQVRRQCENEELYIRTQVRYLAKFYRTSCTKEIHWFDIYIYMCICNDVKLPMHVHLYISMLYINTWV